LKLRNNCSTSLASAAAQLCTLFRLCLRLRHGTQAGGRGTQRILKTGQGIEAVCGSGWRSTGESAGLKNKSETSRYKFIEIHPAVKPLSSRSGKEHDNCHTWRLSGCIRSVEINGALQGNLKQPGQQAFWGCRGKHVENVEKKSTFGKKNYEQRLFCLARLLVSSPFTGRHPPDARGMHATDLVRHEVMTSFHLTQKREEVAISGSRSGKPLEGAKLPQHLQGMLGNKDVWEVPARWKAVPWPSCHHSGLPSIEGSLQRGAFLLLLSHNNGPRVMCGV